MKKALAFCLILALGGVVVSRLAPTSLSASEATLAKSSATAPASEASEDRQIKSVELPLTISPAEIGLCRKLFDVPVPLGTKLTVYVQASRDGVFDPELSEYIVYDPGQNEARTCQIGVTAFNPNNLLPPELQTNNIKLSYSFGGTRTVTVHNHWVQHEFKWANVDFETANSMRLSAKGPVLLGTWKLTVMKPNPNVPNSQILSEALRVEWLVKRESIGSDETEHKDGAGNGITAFRLDKPIEAVKSE